MKHKTSSLTLFAFLLFTPFLTFAQKRSLPPDVSYVAKVHILDQAKEIAVNRSEMFLSETSVCKDYPCTIQLFSFMYGLNEGLVLKHVALRLFSVDDDYLDTIKSSFIAIQSNKTIQNALGLKLKENCEQLNFDEKMKSDCIASVLIDNYALFGYYVSSEYVELLASKSSKDADK